MIPRKYEIDLYCNYINFKNVLANRYISEIANRKAIIFDTIKDFDIDSI